MDVGSNRMKVNIIGGGIIGMSTAYHLAKKRLKTK